MVTGDKMETAVNVSYASGHFRRKTNSRRGSKNGVKITTNNRFSSKKAKPQRRKSENKDNVTNILNTERRLPKIHEYGSVERRITKVGAADSESVFGAADSESVFGATDSESVFGATDYVSIVGAEDMNHAEQQLDLAM